MRYIYKGICLFLICPMSWAGVELKIENMSFKSEKIETQHITIGAQSNKLLINNKDKDSKTKKSTMLFDADEQVMTVVQHESKEYIVMDRNMVSDISGKMDEAMKKMQEQMAKMPPEQRAMMEKMFSGKFNINQEKKNKNWILEKPLVSKLLLGKNVSFMRYLKRILRRVSYALLRGIS